MSQAQVPRVDLNVVGGKVVTPAGIRRAGIAVQDGRIVGVMAEHLLPPAREVIDARGRYVMPGVVDPEGHPGNMDPLVLDIKSETRAAAVGGITTWGLQSPSPRFGQEPFKQFVGPEDVVSFHKVFHRARDLWNAHSLVDVYYSYMMETDEQAEEIPEYAREHGVTSYKFYCHCRRLDVDSFWFPQRAGLARGFDDGTFFRACERTAEIGAPGIVMFHPENWEIARVLEKRLLAAGRSDMGAWDDRSPWFTEAQHIRAYGFLGKVAGCRMYVQHCTNPLSLREVVRAREEGVEMHAQTGAVWLYFNRDDWRINVPLRNQEAIEAQWAALRDGVLECVSSDHVVGLGSREQMTAEPVWSRTKSAFPSRVEALLPIMLHAGVNQGRIGFERLVEVCCENPARIFGLYPKKGALLPGSDADMVIVDLDKEVQVQDQMIHSRPGWSLLTGRTLKGWPVTTILRGKVIACWRDGEPRAEVVGEPTGRYVPRVSGQPLYPPGDA